MVTIECTTEEDGSFIHWWHNGVSNITNLTSGYALSVTERGSNLTIENFTIATSGQYRCVASDIDDVRVIFLSHIASITAFSEYK